jgi:hypothetical protein
MISPHQETKQLCLEFSQEKVEITNVIFGNDMKVGLESRNDWLFKVRRSGFLNHGGLAILLTKDMDIATTCFWK